MVTIVQAREVDAASILELQKLAYQSEAALYNDWSIPPLTQSLASMQEEFAAATVLKAELDAQLVGSVRARATAGACAIGRLIVHPQFRSIGLSTWLVRTMCARATTRYVEAFAAMGRVHPFFTRAGMTGITVRGRGVDADRPVYFIFDRRKSCK